MTVVLARTKPVSAGSMARSRLSLAGVCQGLGLAATLAACAAAPPSSLSAAMLGTAETFTAVGGSTVTNTGSTTIVGNVGVSPGLAVTGFPPGSVTGGVIHAGDAVALQAQQDVTAAYVTLAGQSCSHDLTGKDLGGLTLTPGVYCFSSSAQLTGTLTLDAQGVPDSLFVFQIGSTLITASNASVLVINGAQSCNAYWQVGSSATLGTTTSFVGNILALTSISLTTGVQVHGRALARNGALTMDSNHLEPATCAAAAPQDAGAGSPDAASLPDAAIPSPPDTGPGSPDAGPGSPDAGVAESCLIARCGDTCVDLYTDHDNCGACGVVCSWDLQCVVGSCSCMATTCGDICVDLTENPENCGACGHVCADNQWCDGGSCTSVCAGTICNSWCTDTMTNEDACGGCGIKCGSAETCTKGVCVCTGAMCGSSCVDLSSSLTNCGTCGQVCGKDDCCTEGECVPLVRH